MKRQVLKSLITALMILAVSPFTFAKDGRGDAGGGSQSQQAMVAGLKTSFLSTIQALRKSDLSDMPRIDFDQIEDYVKNQLRFEFTDQTLYKPNCVHTAPLKENEINPCEVEMINIRSEKLIKISTKSRLSKMLFRRVYLMLHEVLGLLEYNDEDYQISSNFHLKMLSVTPQFVYSKHVQNMDGSYTFLGVKDPNFTKPILKFRLGGEDVPVHGSFVLNVLLCWEMGFNSSLANSYSPGMDVAQAVRPSKNIGVLNWQRSDKSSEGGSFLLRNWYWIIDKSETKQDYTSKITCRNL